MLVAICGGVYSNPWALRAFVEDARRRGAEKLYCLGDLGGYGAEPEAVRPLLAAGGVTTIAGNYDVAIGSGAEDCGCGYRDPRDNHYARIMYDYTRRHTSADSARWMRRLPTELRVEHGGCRLHLVHGSTVGLNDFWWESLSDDEHRRRVAASGADVIACTHSGLPWTRRVDGTLVVNVGVLGRPANDGATHVWYALVELAGGVATAQLIPLRYDWRAHAEAMDRAGLPPAFSVTSRTGWWTTCLEILPVTERGRGRYHVYDSSVAEVLAAVDLPATAWPAGEPAIPVRSLWGSPLMPAVVRHACSEVLPQLVAAASRLGLRVSELRGAPPDRSIVAELTLTAEGWFYRPDELGGPPLVPAAPTPAGTVARPAEARAAATTRVLRTLHRAGVLRAPAYCAA